MEPDNSEPFGWPAAPIRMNPVVYAKAPRPSFNRGPGLRWLHNHRLEDPVPAPGNSWKVYDPGELEDLIMSRWDLYGVQPEQLYIGEPVAINTSYPYPWLVERRYVGVYKQIMPEQMEEEQLHFSGSIIVQCLSGVPRYWQTKPQANIRGGSQWEFWTQ